MFVCYDIYGLSINLPIVLRPSISSCAIFVSSKGKDFPIINVNLLLKLNGFHRTSTPCSACIITQHTNRLV